MGATSLESSVVSMRRELSEGCKLGNVKFAGMMTLGKGRTDCPKPVKSGAAHEMSSVQNVFAEMSKLETKPTAFARSKFTANAEPYWSFVTAKPPRNCDSLLEPKTFARNPFLNDGDHATAMRG